MAVIRYRKNANDSWQKILQTAGNAYLDISTLGPKIYVDNTVIWRMPAIPEENTCAIEQIFKEDRDNVVNFTRRNPNSNTPIPTKSFNYSLPWNKYIRIDFFIQVMAQNNTTEGRSILVSLDPTSIKSTSSTFSQRGMSLATFRRSEYEAPNSYWADGAFYFIELNISGVTNIEGPGRMTVKSLDTGSLALNNGNTPIIYYPSQTNDKFILKSIIGFSS